MLKAYFRVNEILKYSDDECHRGAVDELPPAGRDDRSGAGRTGVQNPANSPLIGRFQLPRLVPTRLHLGALIAVVLAVLVYILLWRTTLGYRIRAVGQNPHASRYAGIKVPRYIVLALLLSGAFAGLAGATQVYGVNYRMITDGSASGFTGGAGFNGIVAALFGQLHPIWSIPASILFGALVGRSQ